MKTSFKVIKNLFLGLSLLAFSFVASQAYALGSTPVKVVNPDEIAKAQGIQHPFQTAIQCHDFGRCDAVYTVPENQRLIIESITINCDFPSGVVFGTAQITTSANGVVVPHPLVGPNPSPYGRMINSQLTRIYADPGTDVLAQAAIYSSSDLLCIFGISGQLIDVP